VVPAEVVGIVLVVVAAGTVGLVAGIEVLVVRGLGLGLGLPVGGGVAG
jgi:hypothetical protein